MSTTLITTVQQPRTSPLLLKFSSAQTYHTYSNATETTKSNPFSLPPEALLDAALVKLCASGIRLIEWRAILYRRMNVPMIPKNFSYIVPDSSMELASSTLTNLGLPLSTPDPFLIATEGDFYSKAILHRLTESTKIGSVRYIALYSSSLVSFTPPELSLFTTCTHERFTGLKNLPVEVLVPRPSAVYASLMRLLYQCPRGSSTRSTLQSDLSQLIMHHLYGMSDFVGDTEESDEIDWDVVGATAAVKTWSLEGEWREGEEWMGDALSTIVIGKGDLEWLP